MPDLKDIVAYEAEPPAPMSIFEERVIHPDNQVRLDALKERLERFKPLSPFKLIVMQLRINGLHAQLKRRGVFGLVAELNRTHAELVDTFTAFMVVKLEIKELRANSATVSRDLKARAVRLKQRGEALKERLALLESRLDPHQPQYAEYVRLRDRLNEHIDQVKRRRAEKENEKQFYREGKLIGKALRETFLMTEGCHIKKFRRNGKIKKIAPRFQEIHLSSTVHSFVLLTSKRTIFGFWKNKLQVNIEDLINPKTTLKNASAIIHRQVWVDYDRTGSLPIFKVNRLDIRDGLPERVLFAGLIDIYPVRQHELIPIPAGLGENFNARWMNLDNTPHLLIAGTTRSGKSNFANALICTILYMQSPDEVRFVAIDGKEGVEFHLYAQVPHIAETVTDMDRVKLTLYKAIALMKRRLQHLKDTGAKNILAFNRAVPDRRLPRLIIFIDEMATLLEREDTREIHHALTLLVSQGAAAGVHVIAATQYPNAETIPMSVKNNMDGIVGLRMPNVHASNMLFNEDAAFRLQKIKGRAYISDAGERYKCQTPFISDAEILRGIRFARDQYKLTPFTEWETAEDTEPVAIPAVEAEPAVSAVVFEESDLLEIAFDQFKGALKVRPIFEVVRVQVNVTRDEIDGMVREIVSRGEAMFHGDTYKPIRRPGNFWQLVKIDLPGEETDDADESRPDAAIEMVTAQEG